MARTVYGTADCHSLPAANSSAARVQAATAALGVIIGSPVRPEADRRLQVEAVGGEGVFGVGRVLPPEAAAVVGAGELQDAAQDPGGPRLGQLIDEEVGELDGGTAGDDRLAQGGKASCGAFVGRVGAVVIPLRQALFEEPGVGQVVVRDDVAGDVRPVQQK
jgi:hypothetical protein